MAEIKVKNVMYIDTAFGTIGIAEKENVVTDVFFSTEVAPEAVEKATPLLRLAAAQLAEYFAGKRTSFELPLFPEGTTFQQRVWEELQKIPYGETRSYQDIAIAIGNPNACRAVGLANNRNPISIIIPCHRVIGKNGGLTGYGGGLPLKEKLLALESGDE